MGLAEEVQVLGEPESSVAGGLEDMAELEVLAELDWAGVGVAAGEWDQEQGQVQEQDQVQEQGQGPAA